MVYSRKMLQNDERREQIAKELEGVTWQMKIRSVADTYVFFEHPDFKDHVFCSASIIPSRPLTVGEMMNVEVEHFERESGSSGYTLKTLIRLWANVLGFSMLPLRVASVLGAIIGVVGIVSAIGVIVARAMDPTMAMGWPSTMAAMLTCSGLILLFMRITGEYIGRLYMTANNAPQFVLRRVIDNRNVSLGSDPYDTLRGPDVSKGSDPFDTFSSGRSSR